MSYSPEQIANSPDLWATLRLARSSGIGPVSYFRLISKYGSAQEVAAMLEAATRKGPSKIQLVPPETITSELERSDALNARYWVTGSEDYPPALTQLDDAPLILTILGNKSCLSKSTIGVVGARNCSAGGTKITRKICSELAQEGFTIVSGMARGIDTVAHEASLDAGTVACLAGGVDVIYPQENAGLYGQIIENGLIVSEMAPGVKPQARHFPRRNRIISGLSLGIIVIEAAYKSGSLITANYAASQNRDVFAVPGSPLDPRAQGCNQLIRDGAVLVQKAADIINEYESMPLLRATKPKPSRANPIKTTSAWKPSQTQKLPTSKIIDLLSPTPIHIDELIRLSGIPAEDILTEFIQLEISGDVTRHAGGKYSRISPKNE